MKTFDYLYNVELEGVKSYDGFSYLPWEQYVIQFRRAAELSKLEFNFGPTEWTPTYRRTIFLEGGERRVIKERYAIVHVTVFADDCVWKLAYPVMSGDVPIANPTSFDIHNAHQRAFAKCISINSGFAFRLWVEKGGKEAPSEKPDLGGKIVSLFGQLVPKMGTPDDVHKFLGTTEKSLSKIVDGEGDQQAILSKLQSYFEDELPVPDLESKLKDAVKESAKSASEKVFGKEGNAPFPVGPPEKPVFKSPFD